MQNQFIALNVDLKRKKYLTNYDPIKISGKNIKNDLKESLFNTIDNLIANSKLKRTVDLISVSVEGMGLSILTEANNTINKYKPLIMIKSSDKSEICKIKAFLKTKNIFLKNLSHDFIYFFVYKNKILI